MVANAILPWCEYPVSLYNLPVQAAFVAGRLEHFVVVSYGLDARFEGLVLS